MAQKRLNVLRRLKRASCSPPILTSCYRVTVESVLAAAEHKTLQHMSAEGICIPAGVPHPTLAQWSASKRVSSEASLSWETYSHLTWEGVVGYVWAFLSQTGFRAHGGDARDEVQICQASCAPPGHGATCTLGYLALISEKSADIAGLDFFSWTSSRAALSAAAEFTPSPRGVRC
ncbi:unnamed protein product [Pleuronectes platessa]|uniref:Alkylated DNA repair protein AlkB homologue 8 N-terminal domain-containing protein n=1 Tax=Pleuronectes platessa TaxID=8262 RepID=A0A9N7UB52_PLEPL|nr:unnamed protein product [Pleuronectes platessa]